MKNICRDSDNKGGAYALDDSCCIVDFMGIRIGQFVHNGRVYPSFVGGGGGDRARSRHSGTPCVERMK